MCTGVHLPTMHSHVGVSLLHNPPVLLLQEKKKTISGIKRVKVSSVSYCQLCHLTEQSLPAATSFFNVFLITKVYINIYHWKPFSTVQLIFSTS